MFDNRHKHFKKGLFILIVGLILFISSWIIIIQYRYIQHSANPIELNENESENYFAKLDRLLSIYYIIVFPGIILSVIGIILVKHPYYSTIWKEFRSKS